MGILEAMDYKYVDYFSLFLGAIANPAEVLLKAGQLLQFSPNKFINIFHRIYQKGKAPRWTEEELQKLDDDIRLFKG